jgi:hypothetical protein
MLDWLGLNLWLKEYSVMRDPAGVSSEGGGLLSRSPQVSSQFGELEALCRTSAYVNSGVSGCGASKQVSISRRWRTH